MVRRNMLASLVRKFGRHYQRGDAGCERGRRKSAEILPAVELRERPFADDELRRSPDHDRVRVVVEAVRDAQPPREQDWKRDLVELCRGPVRRPIEKPVLIPATIRALARLR